MTLPFAEICTLLSRLEDIELREPPWLNARDKAAEIRRVTTSWFKSHRATLNGLNVEHAVALLSTLLPERRTDRVYGIQAPSLCRILCRCFKLSTSRSRLLESYKEPGRGDLGKCTARMIAEGGPPARPAVTLIEVDQKLHELAASNRFSAPGVYNGPPPSSGEKSALLENIFKRVSANEGKWLVRLILKNFSPVCIDERLVLKSFHFLLPDLLQFQNNLDAAVGLLKTALHDYPQTCDPRSETAYRETARDKLKPVVGIKVGRPQWTKARSIDHCLNMMRGQRWVLERKYDGEYCEVHIDLSRSENVRECITIFSKSGKDSTADRSGINQTLIDCLRLGKPDSKVKERIIILGELIAYSDTEQLPLPFEHIRRHVTRSGKFIGTDEDSLPKPGEHLAIVFFDLLLLDDELVLNRPIEERRNWLRECYTRLRGRAWSTEWKDVDASDTKGARKLVIDQFGSSIAYRHEGLILKPCGGPYFTLETGANGRLQSYIKLKKDYIHGMGDEADFAVIGASYNAQQALKCGLHGIQWTDFHLGCLMNKDEVLRFEDARPRFRRVGTIQQDHCIPDPILQTVNDLGKFCAVPSSTPPEKFDIEPTTPSVHMDVTFRTPFVFDVLGSGFDRPSDCNFLMLRHPRVKKLHQDREWQDCISFEELQEQAKAARAAPEQSESQETRDVIEKFERRRNRKFDRERTKTPSTARTISTQGTATTVTTNTSERVSIQCLQIARGHPSSGVVSDGTTLIGSLSKRKRSLDLTAGTPCPDPKRLCRAERSLLSKNVTIAIEQETASTDIPSTATPPSQQQERAKAPLADITNTAPTTSGVTSVPSHENPRAMKSNSLKRSGVSALSAAPSRKAALQRLITAFLPAKDSQSQTQIHTNCTPLHCAFADSAVYLAPCIANTPYITQNLLTLHNNVLVVRSLDSWDRDCSASLDSQGFPVETVGESPAYENSRKIVLLEKGRRRQVDQILERVRALRQKGCLDGDVKIFDWRILERWIPDGGHRGNGLDWSNSQGILDQALQELVV
jgi:DNA ligase 4